MAQIEILLAKAAAVEQGSFMQKEKLPRDSNSLAARIVAMSTESDGPDLGSKPLPKPQKEENPSAVARGRLGGLKGGKARAEALSKKKRAEIARIAAAARWIKSGD